MKYTDEMTNWVHQDHDLETRGWRVEVAMTETALGKDEIGGFDGIPGCIVVTSCPNDAVRRAMEQFRDKLGPDFTYVEFIQLTAITDYILSV